MYLIAEIVTLDHSEAVEGCAAHREDQTIEKKERIALMRNSGMTLLQFTEVSYEVWIRGRRSTSSLNVYLILRYISSPREEKSTEMS